MLRARHAAMPPPPAGAGRMRARAPPRLVAATADIARLISMLQHYAGADEDARRRRRRTYFDAG